MGGTETTRRCTVLGGGIVGLSVALELARRGVEVELLDHPRPGRMATPAAAGMLSPLSESSETGPFLEAGMDSLARYPAWVASLREATGLDPWLRTDGKLRLARTPGEMRRLEALLERAREVASPARVLSPSEAREAAGVPLGPVEGALLLERDYQVENRRLQAALHAAVLGAGVRIHTLPPARGVEAPSGRGSARGTSLHLRLDDGTRIPAHRLVLATGAWTGRLEGLPIPLPVSPVRGQMLAFDAPERLPRQVVETESVYLVPRGDGRLLAGATVEDAGFEGTLTASARLKLREAAVEALPELARAPVLDQWCGLRPGTPDGNPILGPLPGLPEVVVASGHFRNGILLAPWTGAALARLLTGGEGPELPAAFLPDRFLDRGIASGAPASHRVST